MGVPIRKKITTRRMVQIVREAGFTEKKDLRENLIGYVPLWREVAFSFVACCEKEASPDVS